MGPVEILAVAVGVPMWAVLIGLHVDMGRFAQLRVGSFFLIVFARIEYGVEKVLGMRR